MTTTTTRPLYEIANEILADIRTQYAGKAEPNWLGYAMPYLEPMLSLYSIEDNYYYDSGKSVVLYALSNLGQWRGEKARAIKAELKALVA